MPLQGLKAGLKADTAWAARLARGLLLGAGMALLPLVQQQAAGASIAAGQWKWSAIGGVAGVVVGWLKAGDPNPPAA